MSIKAESASKWGFRSPPKQSVQKPASPQVESAESITEEAEHKEKRRLNLPLLGVGMIIDGIAALILIVPILLPIATSSYGISPFHFGVVVCLNLVIGLLTPPVGTALFVAANVSGCKPTAIMKPLTPFLLASLFILLLITWESRLVTVILSQ